MDPRLAAEGVTLSGYVGDIAVQAALLHAIVGTLVPLFLVCMLTGFFGRNRSFGEGLAVAPFALFAAFAMTVPYVAVAVLLGPEFPALLGGLIGLVTVVYAARRGFLQPATPWDFPPRERWLPEWMGRVVPDMRAASPGDMPVLRAWVPYVLVTGILVLTRLPQLPVQEFLSGISIEWDGIFGTGVSQSIEPFYLPGSVFLVAVGLTYPVHRMGREQIARSWKVAGRQIVVAGVALLFAVPLVRVFINSGVDFNSSGRDSMPLTLAEGVSSLAGQAWPVFAPWVGALGAFVAGSNTISNLMFSLFQFSTAEETGADPRVVVAAQAVGGAAGNMITVHNVVAACATVGLVGREGLLIRKTVFPMLYYCLTAGCLAYVLIHGVGANAGTLGLALIVAALALIVLWMRRQERDAARPGGRLDDRFEDR